MNCTELAGCQGAWGHMCCRTLASCAHDAVTAGRQRPCLHAHNISYRVDKDLSVADFASVCCCGDRADDQVDLVPAVVQGIRITR